MKVRDLMSTALITVEPSQDLGVALALMHEFGVRRMPVVDPETGALIGIVSDRDIRLAIDSPYLHPDDQHVEADLESLLVGEVMTTHLVIIGPNASVGDAAREMVAHKVGGLPVIELDSSGSTALVGVLTATDLLRYLADLEGERAAEG